MSDNESGDEMDQSENPTMPNGVMTQKDEDEKWVRRKYRQLREEMIDKRLECVDPNSNLIETILEGVNKTYGSGEFYKSY